MCRSMVDIHSTTAEISRGKKLEEEERNHRAKIQVAPSVQRRKVWLAPNTEVPCINAAKTRNPLKLAGVPKLSDRSQPLVAEVHHNMVNFGDMWIAA